MKGIMFRVHGHVDAELVHGLLYLLTADLPASRKATGLRGHSAMGYMCTECEAHTYDLISKCESVTDHEPRLSEITTA